MNPDIDLSTLHYHGFCTAIGKKGELCFNKIHCKGYCHKHYARIRRYNSVNLPHKNIKRCKYMLCSHPYYSSGYCKNHYSQYARKNPNNYCSAENCSIRCVGTHCSKHRTRLKRYGNLNGSGKKKGGTFKTGHTYIRQKKYKICLAKECNRNSDTYKITKGLCPKHYNKWLKKGEYNA